MKPRIFISSVSRELKTARQLVANTLLTLGYEPVWQDIFSTSSEDIRPMLRQKIDSCSAMLQIVGEAYGAEPSVPDESLGRVSYTQFEALYAQSKGKKVYYLIAGDEFPRDASAESIDTPKDDSDAGRIDALERFRLQQKYRQVTQSSEHIFYGVQNHPETELSVRRLKDELDRLRRGFRNWMIGVSASLILIACGVAWLNWGQKELATSVEEAQKKTADQIEATDNKTKEEMKDVLENAVRELTNPEALAERIRKEIQATAEQKINALPDVPGRGSKIAEIEKERDLATGRVDDLVKLIQEGLNDGASPAFQRAADILQKEGTDEALACLESRRESTLETARRHAEQVKSGQVRAESEKEQRNKSLQPLVFEAELLESKLKWDEALNLREQIAELAPDWFDARNRLGLLFFDLARFEESGLNLREALKLADSANKEAVALSGLARLLKDTNHLAEAEPHYRRALAIFEKSCGPGHPDVASALTNLAQLLKDTNRLAEAEPLMRRALAIDEQSCGPAHPDVAIDLNNLAGLLKETNRLAEAEPLYRRALAIFEQASGTERLNIARSLNNLALLLMETNRLAEAEPLYRRALAIDEQSYGAEHPNVARGLNNLALLLQATNRLAEAEPMKRRALAIVERTFGAEHPKIAVHLNNLATLLMETNRLEKAEPLLRRALAVVEQSYGAEHPFVANCLFSLARLLMATNRLTEAESLLRRALVIDEQSFGAESPYVGGILEELALVLKATNRPADAEPLMGRCVLIFQEFGRKTGHEYPQMQQALATYRAILLSLKLPDDEITRRVQNATATNGPLNPFVPEVERLFGAAQPIHEVLEALDRQYRTDGKPAIYFLKANELITPHLEAFLVPTAYFLNLASIRAFDNGDYAGSIVLFEEAIALHEKKPDNQQLNLAMRMNRAAALRKLGAVALARDELRSLLPELDSDSNTTPLTKGRAHYYLGLCEWQLGDSPSAQLEAEKSLVEYNEVAELPGFKVETEQLLADLHANNTPPVPPTLDPMVAVDSARTRYHASFALTSLSLKESALPLIDQILGPPKSTTEVFDALDQQYRDAGKSEMWFLPLEKPIAPYLDELLGPLAPVKTIETRKDENK